MIMLFPGTADGFFGPVCWTCIKASKHWKSVLVIKIISSHNSFLKLKPNVIKTLSQKDLKEWITGNICKYTSCHEH